MQLNLIESNGQYLADSRDVAEVTGKRHSDLIRTIKGYIDTILTDAKLRSSDFFIASTYEDSKGEIRPCFLLTKKGCEMVANKMTGKKEFYLLLLMWINSIKWSGTCKTITHS